MMMMIMLLMILGIVRTNYSVRTLKTAESVDLETLLQLQIQHLRVQLQTHS